MITQNSMFSEKGIYILKSRPILCTEFSICYVQGHFSGKKKIIPNLCKQTKSFSEIEPPRRNLICTESLCGT